jgi:hypothetical protein
MSALTNLINVTVSSETNKQIVEPYPNLRKTKFVPIKTTDPDQISAFSIEEQPGDVVYSSPDMNKDMTLDGSLTPIQHPIFKLFYVTRAANFSSKGLSRQVQSWEPNQDEDIAFFEENFDSPDNPLGFRTLSVFQGLTFDWDNRKLTKIMDMSKVIKNIWQDSNYLYGLYLDSLTTFETDYNLYCNQYTNVHEQIYWDVRGNVIDPGNSVNFNVHPNKIKTWVQVMNGKVKVNGVEYSGYNSIILDNSVTQINFETTDLGSYIIVKQRFEDPIYGNVAYTV